MAAVLVMSTLGGAVAWGQATSEEILAGNVSTAEISGLASNLTDTGTVVTLNDTAFLPASEGVSGIGLWKSDGTNGRELWRTTGGNDRTTQLIKNIRVNTP